MKIEITVTEKGKDLMMNAPEITKEQLKDCLTAFHRKIDEFLKQTNTD